MEYAMANDPTVLQAELSQTVAVPVPLCISLDVLAASRAACGLQAVLGDTDLSTELAS